MLRNRIDFMMTKTGSCTTYRWLSPLMTEHPSKLIYLAVQKNVLECPICYDPPIPPIYLCTNGHSFCSDCRNQMEECGLCKGPLTTSRNVALEAIINSTKFPCEFIVDGCVKQVTGAEYRVHQAECEYRNIICNYSAPNKEPCRGSKIFLSEYVDHLKNQHRSKEKTSQDGSIKLTERIDPYLIWARCETLHPPAPNIIRFNGEVFFHNIRVKQLHIIEWISIFGNDEVASKYFAKIVVKRVNEKNESQKFVEWQIPVYSFRKSVEDVEELSACYSTASMRHLANFVIQGNGTTIYEWKVQVEIQSNVKKIPIKWFKELKSF